MKETLHLSWQQITEITLVSFDYAYDRKDDLKVYGVPRGGIHIAQILASERSQQVCLVEQAEDATLIVDDIIDSGRTREEYSVLYPNTPFLGAIESDTFPDKWIVFPWENEEERGAEENVRRLIQRAGGDPDTEEALRFTKELLKGITDYSLNVNKAHADTNGITRELVIRIPHNR